MLRVVPFSLAIYLAEVLRWYEVKELNGIADGILLIRRKEPLKTDTYAKTVILFFLLACRLRERGFIVPWFKAMQREFFRVTKEFFQKDFNLDERVFYKENQEALNYWDKLGRKVGCFDENATRITEDRI